MNKAQEGKHFYIFDYFLDGVFLRWEEVDCQFPVCGQSWILSLDNGTQIVTQVIEIEQISEDEHRVFLRSSK